MKWTASAVETSVGNRAQASILIEGEAAGDEARAPVMANLAIDRSASMKGAPLGAAVEAAAQLVDLARPDDYLGLLLFDGVVEQRLPVCAMDARGKERAREALRGISVGRGTALHQALEVASRELSRTLAPGRRRALLLLTDGEPSVGPEDLEHFERLGQRIAAESISVQALGLARHYVTEILEAITRPSGNAFAHVDGPEGLSEAMGDLTATLFGQVAQGATVRAEPSGFESLSCRHGFSTTIDGDALVVSAGDVSHGAARRVLLAGPVTPDTWSLTLHGSSKERGDQRHQRIEVERVALDSPKGRTVESVGHELDLVSAETAAWLALARKDLERAEATLDRAERHHRALQSLGVDGFPVRRHAERLADLRLAIERGEGDIPLLVRRARAAREKTSVSQVIPLAAYRNRGQ